MEVKILCPCGAKYKFDVEPLHGKLPGPVSCPVCNVDGTELGNQVVSQVLATIQASTPPSNSPSPGAIRIPGSAGAGVVPAPPTSRSGFVAPALPRSSKDLQAAAQPATQSPVAATAPPMPAPAVAATIAPLPAPVGNIVPQAGAPRLSVQAVHAVAASTNEAPSASSPIAAPRRAESAPRAEPSFTRGLLGIGAASFIGLLLWFAVTLFLGPKFKWAAIGIGALIGWAGHWLAKEKSQRLGLSAAVATLLVMVVGLVWSARHEAYAAVNETLTEMWQAELSYAKEAMAASVSDEKLRVFIAQNEFSDEDEDVSAVIQQAMADAPDVIDPRELADFKKNELPRLRDLASGKVSKSQFEREHRPVLEAAFTFGFIIGSAFRIKTLIVIGLAVGAAWKFTANG